MARSGNNQVAVTIVSERLHAVRKEQKLTQAEFARAIGISPRALTNYELALREIPLSVLVSVHEKFGTDFVWLALGIGVPSGSRPLEVATAIASAIKSFELAKDYQFSPEKVATVTAYLFKENTQNRAYSKEEMHEYLETVI